MPANNDNQNEQQPAAQAQQVASHSYTKGMGKDLNETFGGADSWTHARNTVNRSHDGQLGVVGNEPANIAMATLPYDLIGSLHIYKDRWVLFTTDDTDSEIGIFEEGTATYTKVVNDQCLGFKRTNLITGATKQNFDCTWSAYWDDGLNPSRTINLDNPPYIEQSVSPGSCKVVTYSNKLDCEKLRLAPLIQLPSISLRKGSSGGSLLNGSYQAVVAYTVNQVRVTDYFTPSNVQGIFTHENANGSLEVDVASMDTNFDEFELVVISVVNQQTVARRMGVYSTRQTAVYIDHVADTLPAVSLDLITLQTPAYEKSDSMYEVNHYLIRTGIYTKFDFNYQVQANNINTKWVAIEYPQDYYVKGGNNTSYMRDEQYPFFIRWLYNTGQKSASYHIPGRASVPDDMTNVLGPDAIEANLGGLSKNWMVNNTATISSLTPYQLPDGGMVVKEGGMGYWESTEIYPDNKPLIWGKLCGTPIRHHKFPDNSLVNHFNEDGTKIIVLGVRFENITLPLDNEGNPITSITGYEILRGSRDGNKTVVAKGVISNMGQYDIPDAVSTKKGLYANYPYNDLRLDPFLSTKPVGGGCSGGGYTPMGTFKKDMFTFHSPETQFRSPFLSEYELKIHGELSGNVLGNFDKPFQHPRHKLLRDFALIVAGIIGIGEALHKIKGKKTTEHIGPSAFNLGIYGIADTIPAGPAAIGLYYGINSLVSLIGDVTGLDALATIVTGTDISSLVDIGLDILIGLVPGAQAPSVNVAKESTAISEIPLPIRILEGLPTFTSLFSQESDKMLDIIRTFSPYQQYAYQYTSHGFLNKFKAPTTGNIRRHILKSNYLEQHLQDFNDDYRINNLFRPRTVALQIDSPLADPTTVDNTRQTIGDQNLLDNPTTPFLTTTSAHYASMKVEMPSQYGQLENISQLPISTATHAAPDAKGKISSPILFGGDIYINRYTEKNTFFYFNDWLCGNLPDGFEYDYRLRYNVPYPRYWMDSQAYDVAQLSNALLSFNFKGDVLPNDLAHLDRNGSDCNYKISFIIKNAYFYLFNSGVRDFYVESEVNLAFRDYGERDSEKVYIPQGYTDLKAMFRSDIIKSNNYYKYDYSLSVSKLYQNFTSWGSLLPRYYDPEVAESCYSYYPKRAIYSLPQPQEFLKDNWKVFLVNNYKDFPGKITAIKSISQYGALIMMENDSPVMFQGIDQLQTGAGVKLTVGDGGLFSSPMQPVGSGDVSFEYGTTQNKYSVVSTPNGLYYVSVDQGKIFEYGGVKTSYYAQPLQDIGAIGNKYWFEKYLPYRLLQDFPNFSLIDNHLIGIGCQTVFDNSWEMLYFCKKDYALKLEYKDKLVYYKDNLFLYNNNQIALGNPLFFDDASWTLSFDQQSKVWISFHDWKPDFTIPGKNHFMTVKDRVIYRHNSRCDLYCNFYGVDYPWELEFIQSTGQGVNMVRSMEYTLECFKYAANCVDRFHELDYNFDRACIYNSEQNTGMLNLIPDPKANPFLKLQYPKVGANSIDILCSKVEQKYRFNQFWDATKDRGQISGQEFQMWNTSVNGYERQLYKSYIDYQKSPLQRKKLRHSYHKVFLKRGKSDNIKMLLKISNIKLNTSER
jgi:hypothetical protein